MIIWVVSAAVALVRANQYLLNESLILLGGGFEAHMKERF